MSPAEPDGRQLQQNISPWRQIQHLRTQHSLVACAPSAQQVVHVDGLG